MMLETVHSIGSRIRHSRFLQGQTWLWELFEPYWQRAFERLSVRRGFMTDINQDRFRLVYGFGARYGHLNQRAYEPSFYQAFVRAIEPGMTVLDIGAHIGIFTLGAAKRVGQIGRVYAFEPAPETAAILTRHAALNGWQDRVQVIPAVVSDVDGIVPFYVYGLSMAASMSRKNVEALNPENPEHALKVEIPLLSLDQFCHQNDIKPQVLKIDVEGAELLVLRGAKTLLSKERLSIWCEVHPRQMQNCGSSLVEFEAYLHSVGYRLERVGEPNAAGIFHCHISRRADN